MIQSNSISIECAANIRSSYYIYICVYVVCVMFEYRFIFSFFSIYFMQLMFRTLFCSSVSFLCVFFRIILFLLSGLIFTVQRQF